MKQTIEIEVPDGKRAVWKDDKVIFEDIKSQLPKTWDEFCSLQPIEMEYYITNRGYIDTRRKSSSDKHFLPSKKAEEQHHVLMKLHQLRDCYRQGWVPKSNKTSFGIVREVVGGLYIDRYIFSSKFLTFQTKEIAEEFLDNFRDLIEQAGDLI